MKISIALATYNGAKYLDQQLSSFVEQNRLPDELVVSDDASTDATLSVLRSFAERAPFPVRIHRNTSNLGYAQNFGVALSLCTGDLVFLSDQDDYWFPTKIAVVADVAQVDARSQVFINDAEVTDESLRPTGLTKLHHHIRATGIPERSFVQGSCAAVRRDFLRHLLPIPSEYWAHDSWIVGVAQSIGRKRLIPQALQYYRRHSSNTSHFVGNRPTMLSRLEVTSMRLTPALRLDTRGYLRRESAKNQVLSARVDAIVADPQVDSELAADFRRLRGELTCRMNAIRARMALMESPRLARVAPVTLMLVRGEYSYFAGFRTACRDLLFP